MYLVHFYKTSRGKYPVRDFIQQLPEKSRAKIWMKDFLLRYDQGEFEL